MARPGEPWKVRDMRYLLVILAACGGVATPARQPGSRLGTLAGIARDKDSGDVIAEAKLHLRAQGSLAPIVGITHKDGSYELPRLAPGSYSLVGMFAGQQVDIENIVVKPNTPTVVDLEFTLGHPDPITVDFGDPRDSAIETYKHSTPVIEGVISDRGTRDRVAGAAVTALAMAPGSDTLMTVSDAQGRYRFDHVQPGIYVVSAYYSVADRTSIEIRRSDIRVDPQTGVLVPLWIETTGR